MKRGPRNPDVKSKPAVIAWFKKNQDANKHFQPTIDFLTNHYLGSNYGHTNKKAHPEYKFNSIGKGERYVKIIGRKNHTIVRFFISPSQVKPEYIDYHKTLALRNGERTDAYDFTVSKTGDLKIISDFLRNHEIHHFSRPKSNEWRKYKIDCSGNFTSIRLQSGEAVEISQEHLKLSNKLTKWLGLKGYKDIKNEYVLANNDRVDITFKLNKRTILAELKTVSGSSTKRAIREALGQVLDYQYYGKTKFASELWIVVNAECTDNDTQFIEKLIQMHKLPLQLVWEYSKGFKIFPEMRKALT